MREKIERRRLIELKNDEGFYKQVWALVVGKLPERMILGNSFLNHGAIINYETRELLLRREEDQKRVCGVERREKKEKMEGEIIREIDEKYKC